MYHSMGTKKQSKIAKAALSKTKSGLYVGAMRTKGKLPTILRLFGCQKCSWIGTNLCPHNKMIGEKHANGICSDRVNYLKEEMGKLGTVPRLIQNEEALKLKLITDRMIWEYAETGELADDFKHLNKNLISLIDKMRRQDEGVKIQGELTVAHEDFRKMVEVEAKKIEESNNKPRPGEFKEEVSSSGEET